MKIAALPRDTRNTLFTTLVLVMLAIVTMAPVPTQASLVPRPPAVAASGHILMDAATGHIISEHNADERLPPASLTKIMTDFIAAHELDRGNLSMQEETTVSVRAWRMGGSRMFIREGTQVSIEKLLKGVIIQSGNDAAVALAEHIAGSEDAFADLMNQHAQRLGMSNSHFANATGWPDPDQYTSARDMALLSRALIRDYPENYALYREKTYTYNNISQRNRNLLLWRDDTVDGIKTGHTNEAGYCLVASAERDGMRLISVVMGTESEAARARETQQLLNYGFRFFETYNAYQAGEALSTARVWKGQADEVRLGLADDIALTIPRGSHDKLEASMSLQPDVSAPIKAGDILGQVIVTLDGETLLEQPLVALSDVQPGGLFKRLWHSVLLFFRGFL